MPPATIDADKNYSYDRTRATCAQVLATLALHSLNLNVGMVVGMQVFVIGELRQQTSGLSFTEDQASWFGGMIFIAQPLGSVVSGFLQDVISRKVCMRMVNIPLVVAWLMMHYATSITTLYIAMALLGLSIGFMEAPVLAYIGEISEPRLRGVLSTFGGIFFNTGLMLVTFIGATTDWRSMMLFSTAGPVFSFLAIPDSPAWLLSKGRLGEAQKAYQWLRGWVSPKDVQDELDALLTYIRSKQKGVEEEFMMKSTKEGEIGELQTEDNQVPAESKLKIFLHPSIQRPLRLIFVYFFISFCATLSGMKPFLKEVLSDIDLPVSIDELLVYGSILTLVGSITASLTLHRLGKRGLTFLSLSLSVLSCLGLGTYLALDLRLPWVPFMLFNLSSYAATLGILFIPWVLICEVFPLKGRGVAGGVAAASCYVFIFLFVKTFYNITALVGVSGTCFLYGTVGLIGYVYLYFNLPETEGLSLENIEVLFNKGGKASPEGLEEEKEPEQNCRIT